MKDSNEINEKLNLDNWVVNNHLFMELGSLFTVVQRTYALPYAADKKICFPKAWWDAINGSPLKGILGHGEEVFELLEGDALAPMSAEMVAICDQLGLPRYDVEN